MRGSTHKGRVLYVPHENFETFYKAKSNTMLNNKQQPGKIFHIHIHTLTHI